MKIVQKTYKVYKIASKLYRYNIEYKGLYEAARDAYLKAVKDNKPAWQISKSMK